MAINVMLNKSDQTDFLKLSRHGLEARNDSDSFESVRGTVAVTSGARQRRRRCKRTGRGGSLATKYRASALRAKRTGAWYYEVMVYTAGILQIGWATKHCLFESEVWRAHVRTQTSSLAGTYDAGGLVASRPSLCAGGRRRRRRRQLARL